MPSKATIGFPNALRYFYINIYVYIYTYLITSFAQFEADKALNAFLKKCLPIEGVMCFGSFSIFNCIHSMLSRFDCFYACAKD